MLVGTTIATLSWILPALFFVLIWMFFVRRMAEKQGFVHKLIVPHAVRLEAAHALGQVARNVHREKPGEVVAGREELLLMLEAAESVHERRAAAWALAAWSVTAEVAKARASAARMVTILMGITA